MDNNTRIGFCAEYHNQDYKCANCGHCESRQKITNFYEHKTADWSNEVCPKCGFKSLKPEPNIMLSDEDIEVIKKAMADNKKAKAQ